MNSKSKTPEVDAIAHAGYSANVYITKMTEKARELEMRLNSSAPAGSAIRVSNKLKCVQRITDYLWSGGLFNPEMANHDAVRDLLTDCRVALVALEQEAMIACRAHDWYARSAAELRLRCGELAAEEVRLIRAVLTAVIWGNDPHKHTNTL